jgi:hypothetical protein
LPTAHGFQEFWGYLYHLDAMQGVSFPDINSSPTVQTITPPCKNTPVRGLSDPPGAVDPKTTLCVTPPRPVIACTSSDGTEQNQTCKDEGPLTLNRSRTVDEEISAKVVDFLDRNDPKKTNKPFFVYYNPARMHVVTVLSPKYEAMLGAKSGKNYGPDGGVTPFKGQKGEAWEGGFRSPMVIRWPGHIQPGTIKDQMFAALDWVPTLVDIAGGPKGGGLRTRIEAGQYPGILKTTLDGFDQRDYLEGKSDSVRDTFFYYSGAVPSAVRWKDWKWYYTMAQPGAEGWILPLVPFHWALVDNLKRDPFEQAVGSDVQSAFWIGGSLGAPMTALQYELALFPIGTKLWMQQLESYRTYPPCSRRPPTIWMRSSQRSKPPTTITRATSRLRHIVSTPRCSSHWFGQRGIPRVKLLLQKSA